MGNIASHVDLTSGRTRHQALICTGSSNRTPRAFPMWPGPSLAGSTKVLSNDAYGSVISLRANIVETLLVP